MSELFEIGDKVFYMIKSKNDNHKIRAVVLEDKGEFVDVVTHFLEDKPHIQKVSVLRSKLIKY
jgi:hypothetical protein